MLVCFCTFNDDSEYYRLWMQKEKKTKTSWKWVALVYSAYECLRRVIATNKNTKEAHQAAKCLCIWQAFFFSYSDK